MFPVLIEFSNAVTGAVEKTRAGLSAWATTLSGGSNGLELGKIVRTKSTPGTRFRRFAFTLATA